MHACMQCLPMFFMRRAGLAIIYVCAVSMHCAAARKGSPLPEVARLQGELLLDDEQEVLNLCRSQGLEAVLSPDGRELAVQADQVSAST